MNDEERFEEALKGVNIPVLTLDMKWHRLFDVHGKTAEIAQLEKEVNGLLSEQGSLRQQLKEFRAAKVKLMQSIVVNMNGASEDMADSIESRKLDADKRLIDEINEKIDVCEDRLIELPRELSAKNKSLMLASMDYCYGIIRENEEEAQRLGEWIDRVRVELKENIIRKQECEDNSREIYAYMHDILGPGAIGVLDVHQAAGQPGRKLSKKHSKKK